MLRTQPSADSWLTSFAPAAQNPGVVRTRMYWRRATPVWLVAALVVGVGNPARAELGWSEAQYVKRFGLALHSPLSANEAQFVVKDHGQIVAIFSHGRSVEEAWLIQRQPSFVPPDVLRQARRMIRGTPARRVDFRLPRAPAAQIFESRVKGIEIQVDYRNGAIMRIDRCRGPQPCVLLDRFLTIDRNTDALIARTEAALRREGR